MEQPSSQLELATLVRDIGDLEEMVALHSRQCGTPSSDAVDEILRTLDISELKLRLSANRLRLATITKPLGPFQAPQQPERRLIGEE